MTLQFSVITFLSRYLRNVYLIYLLANYTDFLVCGLQTLPSKHLTNHSSIYLTLHDGTEASYTGKLGCTAYITLPRLMNLLLTVCCGQSSPFSPGQKSLSAEEGCLAHSYALSWGQPSSTDSSTAVQGYTPPDKGIVRRSHPSLTALRGLS